jgi:DUF4097 and DUF4098 domain-containing protein YvlB
MKSKIVIIVVVILALMATCVGIVMVGLFAYRVQGPNVTKIIERSVPVEGGNVQAQTTEEKSFAVTSGSLLQIDIPFGNVSITASSGDSIQITAVKTAWGNDQTEADLALKDFQVTIVQEANMVRVTATTPRGLNVTGPNRPPSVDLTISVPAETTVDVHASSGDLSLSGTRGKVSLYTAFGSIHINDLQAGVFANTMSGDVTARNIRPFAPGQGDVDLTSSFGNVTLEDTQTTSVKITTDSGSVRLNTVQADTDVTVSTGFGSIDLQGVKAQAYHLTDKSGTVQVNGASGTLTVEADFGDIQVENAAQTTVSLTTKSGQVAFSGTLGSGQNSLQSDFGSIRISLPADSAFSYDLQSDFGNVSSQFHGSPQKAGAGQSMTGTVNGGGPSLSAFTKSGNITLEKSS